jgi:membrane-associated HD superfamily phosphohydrolase
LDVLAHLELQTDDTINEWYKRDKGQKLRKRKKTEEEIEEVIAGCLLTLDRKGKYEVIISQMITRRTNNKNKASRSHRKGELSDLDLTSHQELNKEKQTLGNQEAETSRLPQLISAFETGGSDRELVYHSESEVSERAGARKREKSLSGGSLSSGTKPPMKRTYILNPLHIFSLKTNIQSDSDFRYN